MVDELKKYQRFFKHIQLDTYWIVCLIHNNPGVDSLVQRMEKALEWGDEMPGFTIEDEKKNELEFFELIDGNGYKIKTEPSFFLNRTHVKIEIM